MLQSNNIPDDILIEILKFYQPNFIESLKPISSRFNRLICKHFHRVYIPTLVIEISFDNAILIRVARLEGTLISDQCLSTYLNPRFRIHSMEIVYSDPSINSLNESFLRLRAVGGLFSGSVQKMHIRGQIRKSIIAFPDEFFANIFDFLIPNSSEFRLGIRLIQFNFNANSENENGPMILWEKIVSYLHRNLSCGIIRLEIEAFETLFGESSFVSVLESIQEKMIEALGIEELNNFEAKFTLEDSLWPESFQKEYSNVNRRLTIQLTDHFKSLILIKSSTKINNTTCKKI